MNVNFRLLIGSEYILPLLNLYRNLSVTIAIKTPCIQWNKSVSNLPLFFYDSEKNMISIICLLLKICQCIIQRFICQVKQIIICSKTCTCILSNLFQYFQISLTGSFIYLIILLRRCNFLA